MPDLKTLVIDDEQLICWSFQQNLGKRGHKVYTASSAEEGLNIFKKVSPDIVFLDNKLPHMQGLELIEILKNINEEVYIVFMSAYGSVETAVKAVKSGAYDYVNKPFDFEEIYVILDKIVQKIKCRNEVHLLRRDRSEHLVFKHIIGQSEEMQNVLNMARVISQSQATTVLLLGESGTGKDLLARAIHNESMRNTKPFVTINCASLPETLLESELFGHEKGAFTDAHRQKKGLFEIADGGTVFLDEIGETSLAVQVKLLNIIENRVFRRVGGTTDIRIDIRIIAATNQDLQELIHIKKFREDLFYRLKVFQLILPPLREHREDIPLLIKFFIESFNNQFRKSIKGITPAAEKILMQYDWPGNVRELRNVVERAVLLESGEYLHAVHFPVEIRKGEQTLDIKNVNTWFEIPDEGFSLYELEKEIIKQTLFKTKNNQTKAAKLMGISRDALRYKIKKYKI